MQLPRPQRFTLRMLSRQRYSVVKDGSDRPGFTNPVTWRCPKLYVVLKGREIHYVGVTNSPMASRLNSGLKAKGKHGYHGYKWRKIKDPLRLLVWTFQSEKGKRFLRELETVEAEFAFHVRKQTNAWPRSQTEIHFFTATPEHLSAVKKMFSICRRPNAA